MNHAMDTTVSAVSLEKRAARLDRPEPPVNALRFLDLMVGGLAEQEIELAIKIPPDWRGQEIQALLFLSAGGRWMELPSHVEQDGRRLRLTLPPTGDPLAHLAVAFVPQRQPVASVAQQ